VRLQVHVMLCRAGTASLAAQAATTTIPIVMVAAGDPVLSGLVKSLGRPGGNVTGTSNSLTDIASKHLELLRDTLRGLSRLAVLMNPDYRTHRAAVQQLQALSAAVGVQILPAEARDAGQIQQAIEAVARQNAEAVIEIFDPIFLSQRHKIAELLLARRLASTSYSSVFAEAGLLFSHGPDLLEFWRRTAYFVDKIVKGTPPANLPVEQPTKFELLINLKTARALGIAIPQAVLLRAERIIE
jgi:putative tryptophan/tyrosine transport system substrate-binding protein